MNLGVNDLPIEVIAYLGKMGLLLQALGVVAILTILFEIIAFIYNRKRLREIKYIKEDIVRIEGKIDKILIKK